ncbi:hypothetical protein Ais01nite_20250 [Asanoa ishikariensis]|uniref:Uncharacterized protein n=1 Tax=Asanoa ishikariensis TaxID=137265 RepID=A0A1H3UAI6_9ACTN|nr:hypothetical protein [Asanoa ishikariensis]GIF63990.1 hypothetical protein Ais01nite_20250 [Asanoa ishikariensis]SDZ59297.1 hypothetical protein SAMN05421684_6849 [Asanoa ishikariensis]
MQPIVPPPLTATLGELNDAVRQLPAAAEHSAPARLRREAIALADVIHRDGEGAHTAEASRLLRRIRGYLVDASEPKP